MRKGDLLNIQPTELKFPFEVKKQSSCSMQLTNKTDQCVAFKVKTTNPKKYCVRPNSSIISPGSSCSVTVTMQAQKEAPADMQCKDKFLLQSVITLDGENENVTPEMFLKEDGKVVEEFKLRVIYIPANPPSPVLERSEEEEEEEDEEDEEEKVTSPRASIVENGNYNASMLDTVGRSVEEPKEQSPEAWSIISKLTEEKTSAIKRNQKLSQELELMRKEMSKTRIGGCSLIFVVLIGIVGILVGYFIKN